MHLCGMDYKYFSPHCCNGNSFGCTTAIRCGNACHGPHSDSLYSGSEHSQFTSPRLVKREAGFPNPRQALIGSNQLWRVNDSPYYRELLVGPLRTNFNEILIRRNSNIFSEENTFKIPSAEFCWFRLYPNVLKRQLADLNKTYPGMAIFKSGALLCFAAPAVQVNVVDNSPTLIGATLRRMSCALKFR